MAANDTPHVLYEGWSGLAYATWNGSNWINQIIDIKKEHSSDSFGVVALDSSGNPHIAFTNGAEVKYASWTGSNWNIQTVDSYSSIVGKLWLALDSNNTAYILYSYDVHIPAGQDNYRTIEEVKLAKMQNSTWSTLTVVSDANDFGNVVLDSFGNPYVIYTLNNAEPGSYNSSIVYASWDGSAWVISTVVPEARIESIGFLALDSHNNPHIAYINSPSDPRENNSLEYASLIGKAWISQNVDTDSPLLK